MLRLSIINLLRHLTFRVLPRLIGKVVFGYSSIYGRWGWSLCLALFFAEPPRFLHPPYEVVGMHAYFASVGKWLMVSLIVGTSFVLNRRERKPPLFHQVGLIIAIFLTFTPGFGSQYLVWLVPFVVSLGLEVTAVYYAITTIYLLVYYSCDPTQHFYCSVLVLFFLMLATWGEVIIAQIQYWRKIRRVPRYSESTF